MTDTRELEWVCIERRKFLVRIYYFDWKIVMGMKYFFSQIFQWNNSSTVGNKEKERERGWRKEGKEGQIWWFVIIGSILRRIIPFVVHFQKHLIIASTSLTIGSIIWWKNNEKYSLYLSQKRKMEREKTKRWRERKKQREREWKEKILIQKGCA